MKKFDDAAEIGTMCGQPQPITAGRYPAGPIDCRCLREDQSGAAECEPPEMDQMEIISEPFVRAVHRHGRDHYTVLQCDSAEG